MNYGALIICTDSKKQEESQIDISHALSCALCILRAATGGKTAKTEVLPRFCKIERGSGGASGFVATTMMVLPAKTMLWQP